MTDGQVADVDSRSPDMLIILRKDPNLCSIADTIHPALDNMTTRVLS